MAKGWIRLHRSIQDNPLWLSEPFTKAQAWVDLLLLADHENVDNYKKGCVYKSVSFLAERWQWSRGKVRRYLEHLESQQMIHRTVHQNGHTLTIVKYGFYQGGEPAKRTQNRPHNDTANVPHTINKEIIDYNALPTASEIIYGGYT